jgi:hypothetical protein
MTTQHQIAGPGLPPETVCSYIEDMLMELARMANKIGEPRLAPYIEVAAAVAHQANLRRIREAVDNAA